MDAYIETYVDNIELDSEYDENFDYHDVIREVLDSSWQNASDEAVDSMLDEVLSGMSPEEVEGFWSALKSFGKSAGKIAPSILPVAGQVIGGIYGGPAGAAIGGAVGGMAGQAIGKAVGGKRSTPQRPVMAHSAKPVTAPSRTATSRPVGPVPATGTSAQGQLAALIQNPSFLQSLLGQVMGKSGQSTVSVGSQGKSATFGAFMNALAQLAMQAARESEGTLQAVPVESSYLTDTEGNLLCDSAVAEQRARVLLEQLNENALEYVEDDVDDMGDIVEWLMDGELTEY